MLEWFNRGLVEDVNSGLPDVRFLGFDNEDFPYRIGIDIDAYQKLLQDTLQIKPKDISRIQLRFVGFVPDDQVDQTNEDLNNLEEENNDGFVNVVSMHNELVVIMGAVGASFAYAEPKSAVAMIKGLFARKLLFESYKIKGATMDRKFHKKKGPKIATLLDQPLTYGSEFIGLEYLLKNFSWSQRATLMLYFLISSKLGLSALKNRYVKEHHSIESFLNEKMNTYLTFQDNGDIDPEVIKEWENLITVYPTGPAES